ncbi:MAG: inositol monophosphatase family protein [Candidatus Micrarchaeia archaeon]
MLVKETKTEKSTGYLLDFALSIAHQAETMIKNDFDKDKRVFFKEDNSPVTHTDQKINDFVLKRVTTELPGYDLLSEEGSYLENKSKLLWVCDPLDGTIAFTHKIPTCCFSIALLNNGIPILGVISEPFLGNTYHTLKNSGSYLNNTKITVSKKTELRSSVIGMSYWPGAKYDLTELHKNLIKKRAAVLLLGSIAYTGSLVSSGNIDVSIHPGRDPFDTAALSLLIEEAGGVTTDLTGKYQRYDSKIKGLVSANPEIHGQVIKLLKRSK